MQILFTLGGSLGSLAFGLLMDRWRPRLVVLAIYAGFLGGLAGLGLARDFALVAAAGFAAGLFVVDGQLVLYALAPQLYPVPVRATGTGAAVAVGRLGAMAGPLAAGQVLALGGSATILVIATAPVVADPVPPPLVLEPLARFEVALDAPVWELGATSDLSQRRIIPITGGRFAGPRLRGTILNNGADWQVVTAEGVAIIDTRYLLRTDDGALIYLQTKGYRHGPPEVLRELAAGRPVDPRHYYFRLTLTFETAAPAYAWLNRTLGVGSAMRLGKAVVYDAYLVQ